MSKIDDLIKELCPGGVKVKELGDIAVVKTGQAINKTMIQNSPGDYPVVNSGKDPLGYYKNYNTEDDPIGVTSRGAGVGSVTWYEGRYFRGNLNYSVTIKEKREIMNRYLFHLLLNDQNSIQALATYDGIPALNASNLKKLSVSVPPLEVQKEIVRVLDSFTELEAELEARKKQYEYYRNTLLTFEDDRNITWVELGKVAKYEQPTKYIVRSSDYNDDFSIPVLTAGKTFILGYTDESSGVYNASVHPVIIFDDFTTANKWVDFDFKVKSSAMKIITSVDEGTALLKYIYHWLNTLPSGLVEGDHKRQWISSWSKKKIPIPPLEKQQQIVSILDKFEKLTNDISVGLPAEIEARRKQYEYYRNKLLTFKELECSR